MPFRRTARAIVSHPGIEFDAWMEELRRPNEGAVSQDHIHRIAKTVLRKCDPNKYLLSHATIVASVDTYSPKNVKTGTFMDRGVQISVRWPDFRIKSECDDIINNNKDAWSRSVLLSTYRTFIGAPNYLEHIQIPELSKGFIVDAVARDIGRSVYTDILVATDRQHGKLIQDILTGHIDSMSMGCVSLFTTCTKCGNVAVDDSQICACIRYEGKGTKFTDEDGIEHQISELIGHVSIPNSNQFIEASWVANPAFRGAVRRNILNPDMSAVSSKVQLIAPLAQVRLMEPTPDGLKKAASLRQAQGQDDQPDLGQDQGGQDDQDDQAESDDKPESKDTKSELDSKIDELIGQIQETTMQGILDKLQDRFAPKPEEVGYVQTPAAANLESPNDNMVRSSDDFTRLLKQKYPNNFKLVRWATETYKIVHEGGIRAIKASGLKARDLLVLSWIEDRVNGFRYSDNLYKVAIAVGPLMGYPTERSFFAACKAKIGRPISDKEAKFFRWKGKIASII